MERPRAILLPIGNELLSGKTRDSNSPYAASRLTARGIALRRILTLPDEMVIMVAEIRAAARDYDLVITSGGIGATADDLTRQAVAAAFERPLERNAEAEAMLGPPTPGFPNDARYRMADLPAGCRLIPNPITRAPGFIVDNCYVLPGVPELFEVMFDSIAHEFPGAPIFFDEFFTHRHEGEYAAIMDEAVQRFPSVNIGSYPRLYYSDKACLLTFSAPAAEAVAEARAWFQDQLDALPPRPPLPPRREPAPATD